MGKSFYLAKKDADLHIGSNIFATLISASPESYGISSAQSAEYAALNASFSAAYLVSQAPETRTKSTIYAFRDAKILLIRKASELAKIINANPAVTTPQKIGLGLAVRGALAPKRAPGTVSNFKVRLLSDGSVQLTWRPNNPAGLSGVTYQIWRRFGSSGEFSFVGASGEKKFVDSTIPAGTPQVQYQIRGIRPTGAGRWAQFNLNFGQVASGTATAPVVQTNVEPKMAA